MLWNYSIDSFKDGTDYTQVGEGSDFEFYGMAMTQTKDSVIFAFNSNLAVGGSVDRAARNGLISYGDLMLNFTGKSFNESQGSLYGIRFDQSNDGSLQAGLYHNATATSVSTVNQGYKSLNDHTARVGKLGGQASYGDLASNTSYFDATQASPNILSAGNYVGGVSMITDFSGLGLDFGNFGTKGKHTFGFSIARSLLPTGDFVASLFAECGNDGIALNGSITPPPVEPPAPEDPKEEPPTPVETKDVPEPSVMAGLSAVGLLAARRLRRRQRSAQA